VAAERAVLRIELSSAQQKLAALQGGTGAPSRVCVFAVFMWYLAAPAQRLVGLKGMLGHPSHAGSRRHHAV
jgi:hypothetical protein